MIILAATPDLGLSDYGLLGVGVVALVSAVVKMFFIFMKDRDKAISDRDTMIQDQMTQVLPLVLRSTEILEQFLPVLRETNLRLQENTKAFEEVKYILIHGRGNSNIGGS